MRGLIAIYDADEHKRFTAYVDIAQDLPLRDALPLISRITRGRRDRCGERVRAHP